MHQQGAQRLRRIALILAVGLAGSAVGLVVNPLPAKAAVGAPPPGFTLTWSDDFTGAAGTGLDTSVWKYDTGTGFGTGEIETMTNSTANVFQDGAGHLVLKAIHTGTNPTAGWTSGRIETQAATYGAPAGGVVRMESMIQQPNVTTAYGLGYWPAFWMLGAPLRSGVGWPTSGEIDILEDINGLSLVYGTLHCGTPSGGPCNETSGRGSGAVACNGCQTGYHDYAVEIDRSTGLSWALVVGRPLPQVTRSGHGAMVPRLRAPRRSVTAQPGGTARGRRLPNPDSPSACGCGMGGAACGGPPPRSGGSVRE
jgi:hypothetical protein